MSDQPIKADDHGITCHCRKCTDYWDQDHSKIEPMTTPTPAPSEGPYTAKSYTIDGYSGTHWTIEGPRVYESGHRLTDWFVYQVLVKNLDAAYAAGHSSALASREVADLVKAAKEVVDYYQNMSGNPNCPIPDKYWISGAISLRTALAPFAGGEK